MGDLIKRIITAIKNLFSGSIAPDVKEALSESTPVSRTEIEESVKKFIDLIQKPVKEQMEAFEATHSPVTPEESPKWAASFAGAGIAGLALGTAGSTVAETLSLGQVESLTQWLREAWARLGLAGMVGVPVWELYSAGVRTPFRYYALGKFQPMIPSISDQIRFAVREAYPDVPVEKMHEEMKKWIRYLGYSEFWAKAYWNAHWVIPTLEQARKLFLRGVITEEEYKDFLRLSDYHPKYNNLWLELRYDLPGRIDSRWMYEWNIINIEELKKFIAAEGVHPDWINKVAEAYAKNILRDEIGRVRTQMINLFREGFWSESKLRNELRELGFREEVIDWSIREAKLKREYEDKTDKLKFFTDQLIKWEIDEETFIMSCRELGMDEDVITLKLDTALLRRKPKKKS